ncbi:unnamed protein product [Symbiodinium natans]|uniref:Uncharacterized protein n=1 Tax=Symbiodinium natans TaxID=878477 RepID=A0A812MZ47_9DINO|nr:unnamed protein product [Symbiodinium natans]
MRTTALFERSETGWRFLHRGRALPSIFPSASSTPTASSLLGNASSTSAHTPSGRRPRRSVSSSGSLPTTTRRSAKPERSIARFGSAPHLGREAVLGLKV